MDRDAAYFQVLDASEAKHPFIIKLEQMDLIDHARRILSGHEKAEIHIQGTIIKKTIPYNEHWAYHVDPASLSFFANAIEVCDATMAYVEENLDDIGGSTLPGGHWCPWSSKIAREVPHGALTDLYDVPLGPETFEEAKGFAKRFDPADLSPGFAAALEKLIQKCLSHGATMVPYTGLRTPWEQAKLWRRSRSSTMANAKIAQLRNDGAEFLAQVIEDVGPQPTGDEVTKAIPGYSWHQWGEAVDSYWEVNGKANWSTTEIHNGVNGYKVYAKEAKTMGLVAGGYWSIGDWPHVHYPTEDSPSNKYTLLEINAEMEKRFGKPALA